MLNLKLKRMKSKTKFFVALAVIATLNLFFQLRVENGAPLVSTRQVMANEPVYYGIIDGEAEITCSGGQTGRCFKQSAGTTNPYEVNVLFYCEWTGSMSNYCSQVFNYAVNWFFNFCGF
jgi:hypothetical protein